MQVYGTGGNKTASATHQVIIKQKYVILVQKHRTLNTEEGVMPARDISAAISFTA